MSHPIITTVNKDEVTKNLADRASMLPSCGVKLIPCIPCPDAPAKVSKSYYFQASDRYYRLDLYEEYEYRQPEPNFYSNFVIWGYDTARDFTGALEYCYDKESAVRRLEDMQQYAQFGSMYITPFQKGE